MSAGAYGSAFKENERRSEMAFRFQVIPRVEKNFRKERLFYVPPDPKAFEIHIETGGQRKPFLLGYTKNLLEEVRELFTPKRKDKIFAELREMLSDPDARCHLCFYFFTPPSDYKKPMEMATAKWLKWRKDSCEFPYTIDDEDLDILGVNRPFDVEFEGSTADEELYK
jgi:hypothetical protein